MTQSVWNDRETLLLMMLSNYLRLTEHRVFVKRLTELFAVYAEQVTDIRKKSTHQVLYKSRHIERQRNICKR
jgi:hypothetical protein